MNKCDIIAMSSQELTRLEIIQRVIRRELTQVKAALMLGITDRRVDKLVNNFKRYGPITLTSKKHGKPSNRAYSEEFKVDVINIVKEKYYDFGPTLATEKLEENHSIKIHHGTLRNWMIKRKSVRNQMLGTKCLLYQLNW